MVLLVALSFIMISVIFYIYINVEQKKYEKIKLKSELSGFEVARKILDKYDLNNIYITETKNEIISKYDSNRKVIRLTNNIFNETNLLSCSVAAKESAYAIQDKKKDKMYGIKNSFMPIINIILIVGYLITLLGCLFGSYNTILTGILIIDFVFLFHLVFYKTEKKASEIALIELVDNKIINKKELKNMQKLLELSSYNSFTSLVFPIIELVKKVIVYGNSR